MSKYWRFLPGSTMCKCIALNNLVLVSKCSWFHSSISLLLPFFFMVSWPSVPATEHKLGSLEGRLRRQCFFSGLVEASRCSLGYFGRCSLSPNVKVGGGGGGGGGRLRLSSCGHGGHGKTFVLHSKKALVASSTKPAGQCESDA